MKKKTETVHLEENINEGLEQASPVETGWENPPSLADMQEDLANIITHHQERIEAIDRWLDLLHIRGSAKRPKVSGRSNVQPKLIRRQMEWRIPTLTDPFLSTKELFNVQGKTFEDIYAAKQNQLVLNYQFDTIIDKTQFIDKYVRTFTSEGTVFLRVGWKFREETREVEVPQYEYRVPTAEDMEVLKQAVELQAADLGKFIALVPENVKHSLELIRAGGLPTFAVQVGVKREEVTVTTANHPTLDIVDYRRLYIDPNCKDNIEDAEVIIYSFLTSMSELVASGKYTNLDKVQIDNGAITTLTDAQFTEGNILNFTDEARKRLVAYEYWGNWDIHGDGIAVPIVATWIGDVLIHMEENPFPDKKHPFVNATYIPVKNSVYGEPDAELLADAQAIYGATMRSMVDILGRTANGQEGMRQDLLDAVNKRKYLRGDAYEFNPTVDARQGIIKHVAPEIPQSATYMLQLQNNEAESYSGVKAYSSGIGSNALGDVAAGIKGALDAASKRDLSILRRLASGLEKAARKIISLNSVFLDETEVVRITENQYVPVRRDDLAGNFDLSLSISTAEENENKASKLAFMLQTLGNTVPFELTKTVLTQIADLYKMPDLAKRLEAYTPAPDPVQQQKDALELQLLQMKVEQEKAQIEEHRAKAQYYLSQTANKNADTNKKVLDFVEQESGTTQERAKELHQAQAEGNIKLELVKAALTKETSQETKPNPTSI
ncbi:MAG: portal protein [Podoviridae sp. ctLUJ1]|nr:MAG: portal protein [Podoviridae sp. ctLUJ1]